MTRQDSQVATVIRTTRYRLVPRTRSNADYLAGLAGAGRYVWNELLARSKQAYADWVEAGEPKSDRPSVTFFSLGKAFTALRNEPGHVWLKGYPFAVVRLSSAKRLADAYARFFNGEAGFPRFKARRGDDSFTIPDARARDGRLWIPKLGKWLVMRRKGGDPWADVGECRQAVVKRELGKWYAYVTWRVPADTVGLEVPNDTIGVDMNAGHLATSDGNILRLPKVGRLEARYRRYQRKMARQRNASNRRNRTRVKAAKAKRRLRDIRRNWHHQVSHQLAAVHDTVVVEDLKTEAMTRKGGRRKRGLNRVVRDTGWHGLRQKLAYKAANLVAVDPRNTSRTCHKCGHCAKENRRSQARFVCGSCGYEGNADVNAALNILASGVGATGRGRGVGAVEATPTIRQKILNGLMPMALRPAVKSKV